MFNHILVPTDFSPSSRAAVATALDVAAKYGSQVTIVHVCDVPSLATAGSAMSTVDLQTPLEETAELRLAEALHDSKAKHPKTDALLRLGEPSAQILDAVTAVKADLVVMSTHGRTGLAHTLFGSVAEKVARACPVPVLTVRSAA